MNFKNYISNLFFGLLILVFWACNSRDITKQPTDASENKSFKDTLISINKYLLKENEEHIKKYIERRNWNMKMTQTGLWYEIYEQNGGIKAEKGKIAVIKYSVELLDGTLCYSSEKEGLKEFKIGQGGVESGLEEALLLMRKGDKAHFILPPHLAYGLIGDSKKIPARAIIVYSVELVEVKDLK